jgi:hypothetical protein
MCTQRKGKQGGDRTAQKTAEEEGRRERDRERKRELNRLGSECNIKPDAVHETWR